MASYLVMYEATRDRKYLDWLINHADVVIYNGAMITWGSWTTKDSATRPGAIIVTPST